MDIFGKARKLESRIARTVDRTAQRLLNSDAREPLEIMHTIVDAVEGEVRPAGRGAHVFPFNTIRVSIVAPTREARARFEAVIDGEPSLRKRILERLVSGGCEISDLVVKVAYVPHAKADWPTVDCRVEFGRGEIPQPEVAVCRIKLTILAGATAQPEYSFTLPRIDLGRCSEVRDRRNRLLRINHVAFADSDAPTNQSVSRCHAHIQCTAGSRECRVYDDHSKQGTGVLRSGRTIAVPPGSLGVRLQPGDEIVLGDARLRFSLKAGI